MTLRDVQPDGRLRELRLVPGYDLRTAKPNCGIHGMEMVFVLRDGSSPPAWALTFEVTTGWMPSSVREAWTWAGPEAFAAAPRTSYGSTIGWHTSVQLDAGTNGRDCCSWLCGQRCYSGSTGLVRQTFVDFVNEGEEAVWRELNRRGDALALEISQALSDVRNFS